MATFKKSIKISLVVLGSVIGAGFITGREILEFFGGQNLLLSSAIFVVLFFVFLLYIFLSNSLNSSVSKAVLNPLIYAGNLIIFSGMLSAIDSLFVEVFKIQTIVFYPSIFVLILSNLVVSKGVEGIENANKFLTPTIVIITLFFIVFFGNANYVEITSVSLNKCFQYVGLNLFMSSILFNKLGKSVSKKTAVLSAVLSSLVLGLLICLISLVLFGESSEILNSDIPLLSIFNKNIVCFLIFSLVLAFGIVTTLFSSHYPLYLLVETKKYNFLSQFLLSAVAFSLSRLGFYSIVAKFYPILGSVGIVFLIAFSILELFFQNRQRLNTLAPQVSTK